MEGKKLSYKEGVHTNGSFQEDVNAILKGSIQTIEIKGNPNKTSHNSLLWQQKSSL